MKTKPIRPKRRIVSYSCLFVALGFLTIGLICALPLVKFSPPESEMLAVTPSPRIQRIPDWVFEARERGFAEVGRYTTPTPSPSPAPSPISWKEWDRQQREKVLWASIGKRGWMDADEDEMDDPVKGPILHALIKINHEREYDP